MIPSRNSLKHLISIYNFTNKLLTQFYNLNSFYSINTKSDLINQLTIKLTPHTSNKILYHIIDFTNTSNNYTHTLFHTTKQKNYNKNENSIILLLNKLLNFSQKILPTNQNNQMDTPLILTTQLNPTKLNKKTLNINYT